MSVIDILNDDLQILDLHRRREARPGLWILSFPGDFMPDGHSFEWQYSGQLTNAVLMKFCNEVRNAYNERNGSQEVEVREPDTARVASSEPASPDAGDSGRGSVPTPPPVQDVEATLEAVISSQVTRLRDQVASVESRIGELGAQRVELIAQLDAAQRALEAYNDGEQDTKAAKPNRRKPRRTKKPASSEGPADTTTDGADKGVGE